MATVWVVGDSTTQDYSSVDTAYPLTGWAQVLWSDHVNRHRATVSDEAISGHSSKSFIEQGLWNPIYENLSEGDFVIIAFGGHNDSKSESWRHTDPWTTYKTYLTQYAQDARDKGAIPIFTTGVCRNYWDGDQINQAYQHGDYPLALRDLVDEIDQPASRVYLVDMDSLSRTAFEAIGSSETPDIFLHLDPGEYPNYPTGITDNTHFQLDGARFLADIFVSDAADQGLPIVSILNSNWVFYWTSRERMDVQRSRIRDYIATLLKTKVASVGGRVFTNRRGKLSTEELPAICIEYGTEPMEVRSGDKYHAKTYERFLQLSIVIGVEETLEAGEDPRQTHNAENLLDVIGHKVEMELGDDWRLARLLSDFDPNTNYLGLVDGLNIKGGSTYDLSEDGEKKIVAREIGLVIYYETQAFRNRRFPLFTHTGIEFSGLNTAETGSYAMTLDGSGTKTITLRGTDGSFVRVFWGDGSTTAHMLLGELTNVVFSHDYEVDEQHLVYIEEFIVAEDDTGFYAFTISGSGDKEIVLRGTDGDSVRIYWGDGSYTTETLLGSSTDVQFLHTYASSGDHQIYLREM